MGAALLDRAALLMSPGNSCRQAIRAFRQSTSPAPIRRLGYCAGSLSLSHEDIWSSPTRSCAIESRSRTVTA